MAAVPMTWATFNGVEDEMRELAGDVADQPVVGGVVVGHERHGDDEEENITGGEVEQQQVDGGPHGAARQRDVDDERVAANADADDESERHRDDHLVEDVVEPQLAVQVHPDVRRHREIAGRGRCCVDCCVR